MAFRMLTSMQRVPNRVHTERQDPVLVTKPPDEHHIAYVRCPGCSATDFEAYNGPNHVPLHLRLYLEDGGN
jgi:hypothetical protein